MKGWIKLNRSLRDNFLWTKKPFSEGQAWIDLLMLANHQDQEIMDGQTVVTLKRGDVNRSVDWLANEWGWSWRKTRRFLSTLEGQQMVQLKHRNRDIYLTIENYSVYQGDGRQKAKQKAEQKAEPVSERVSESPQTYKNEKEIKECLINNNNARARTRGMGLTWSDELGEFVPAPIPSREEIANRLEAMRERIRKGNEEWERIKAERAKAAEEER